MNMALMTLLSVLAGFGITLQSGMSGQLSGLLKNPLLATFSLYVVSTLSMAFVLLVSKTNMPEMEIVKSVPRHLWVAGSVFSVTALTLIYWQMPKIGIAKVFSGVLVGQIITSMVASYYGWFGLPLLVLTTQKLLGAGCLVVGVILINGKNII